jgi:obg-like ATPase 1
VEARASQHEPGRLSACAPRAAVKAAGKWRQEGKQYEVQDGDIIHWKFNVTSSGKK